jgi:hypothetical protein
MSMMEHLPAVAAMHVEMTTTWRRQFQLHHKALYLSNTGPGTLKIRHRYYRGSPTSAWSDGAIRLVGASSSGEGRVEVFHNGYWGTVCNDGFNKDDAKVVCRQLGYQTSSPIAYSSDKYGEGSGKIWMTNVECSGSESRLVDCKKSDWGFVYFCSHSQDVGVNCENVDELSVRIAGESSGKGTLEIFHSGTWGAVCDDRFSKAEAEVVCRQLNYDTSDANFYVADSDSSTLKFATAIYCYGNEDRLSSCDAYFGKQSFCRNDNVIGIDCSKDDSAGKSSGRFMISNDCTKHYDFVEFLSGLNIRIIVPIVVLLPTSIAFGAITYYVIWKKRKSRRHSQASEQSVPLCNESINSHQSENNVAGGGRLYPWDSLPAAS